MELSRRDFLVSSTAAAATGALASPAQAQTPTLVAQAVGAPAPRGFDPADPALKYELVIANGDVLDPSQKLRGKRDIGIRYGQIAAIAASIPADRAVQRIDVAGRLVTPGLVDLHTHLCPHLGLGLPADELVGITCTTTAVSAGDAGWHT
jgi:dihydroorotase